MSSLTQEGKDGSSREDPIDQHSELAPCPATIPKRWSCSPLHRNVVERSYSGSPTLKSLRSSAMPGTFFPCDDAPFLNSEKTTSISMLSEGGGIRTRGKSQQASHSTEFQSLDRRPMAKRFDSCCELGGVVQDARSKTGSSRFSRTLSFNVGQDYRLERSYTPVYIS